MCCPLLPVIFIKSEDTDEIKQFFSEGNINVRSIIYLALEKKTFEYLIFV